MQQLEKLQRLEQRVHNVYQYYRDFIGWQFTTFINSTGFEVQYKKAKIKKKEKWRKKYALLLLFSSLVWKSFKKSVVLLLFSIWIILICCGVYRAKVSIWKPQKINKDNLNFSQLLGKWQMYFSHVIGQFSNLIIAKQFAPSDFVFSSEKWC